LVKPIDPILPKEQLIERAKVLMSDLHVSYAELAREIDITQTGISKVFAGKRDLSYEEVQMMINYLSGRCSIIPPEESAMKYASAFEKLEWAYDDETVGLLANRMLIRGFSQLPVKNRSNQFLGVVSELSLMKRIMHPEIGSKKIKSMEDLRGLRLEEAEVIEEIPKYPIGTKMTEIAQVLMNYYSVLLTDNEEIVGIITRADLLKLVGNQKTDSPV